MLFFSHLKYSTNQTYIFQPSIYYIFESGNIYEHQSVDFIDSDNLHNTEDALQDVFFKDLWYSILNWNRTIIGPHKRDGLYKFLWENALRNTDNKRLEAIGIVK